MQSERGRVRFVSSCTPGCRPKIRAKLDAELVGLWRFLNDPYPDGPNEYVANIEANLERIKRRHGAAQASGHR